MKIVNSIAFILEPIGYVLEYHILLPVIININKIQVALMTPVVTQFPNVI